MIFYARSKKLYFFFVGGCYKHTFYGIESYRCMEMTPSLACANKCVFCWRHHSNPVGTEWKWKMDEPEFLIQEATSKHVEMIKSLKGVPGVKEERFADAFQIRHCALSLVGEPIIYPEINKFVDLLHKKNISTFLVTNAQFPDKIANLTPVTQLYISVDAATKDSLKKIDRFLHMNFFVVHAQNFYTTIFFSKGQSSLISGRDFSAALTSLPRRDRGQYLG